MPPQVRADGARPAVQQPPLPEVHKDESKDVAKSTSSTDTSAAKTQTAETKSGTSTQQEKEPEDPKAAARAAQGSKQFATDKVSQDKARAQIIKKDLNKQLAQKVPGKNDESVWESVKGASQFAMNALNTGAQAIRRSTADAAAKQLADQANATVQKGSENAHDIEREQRKKEIAEDAHTGAFGRPNPLYKKYKSMAPSLPLEDANIYSTLPPKFSDAEKAIQKMDASRDELYVVDDKSMNRLLGSYGYYSTYKGRGEVQRQVTDVALHNWRNTPPEARQALFNKDYSSPALRNAQKTWIQPPQLSHEEIRKDEQIDKDQTVHDDLMPGRHGIPFSGKRGERPDPVMNAEQAQRDVLQWGIDVLNSMGGPAHGKPGVAEPTARSGGMVEGHRGAPPEPVSVAETQPRSARPSTGDATTKTESGMQKQGEIHSSSNANRVTTNSERKSESNAKPAKKPLPQDGLTAKADAVQRQRQAQQVKTQEAIGRLDPGTREVLRDLLRENQVIDQPNPNNNGRMIAETAKAREKAGEQLSSDVEKINREMIRGLENTTDPRITRLLETDPQGRVLLEELRKLHLARLEETDSAKRI